MEIREGVDFIFKSKSRIYLLGCGFFIFGIFLGLIPVDNRTFFIRTTYLYFLLLLFLLSFLSNNFRLKILIVLFLFLILGYGRSIFSSPVISSNHSSFLIGEEDVITGRVVDTQGGVSSISYVVIPDGYAGKILIQSQLYPRYDFGDRLEIDCKFVLPDNPGYVRYLFVRDIFTVCSFGKIRKIGEDDGNWGRKILSDWRSSLNKRIGALWPEPRGSLMAGILYGERGGMPQKVKEDFSNSGLTHIVAVSGYNTSIIAVVLLVFFIFIGFWRKQAFWFSVVSLILFTFFTGASASVARAATMSIFSMLGNFWGRSARMLNSLLTAAALLLVISPRALLDVGFQLSFFATVGVSFVGPLLQKRFWRYDLLGFKKMVVDIFFTTLGALVSTLPLTVFYFNKIPLFALVANMLVVGFVPFIMFLGFFALLLSFLFFPAGLLVAFAADIGLRYIIWVSDKLSIGSFELKMPFIFLLLIYLLIIFWLKKIYKYVQRKS